MSKSLIRHLERKVVDAAIKLHKSGGGDLSSLLAAVNALVDAKKTDPAQMDVRELLLGLRARRLLEELGCETVADVAKLRVDEVIARPGCGAVTLREVRRAILQRGFDLADGHTLDD